jgi:hypothetical protein
MPLDLSGFCEALRTPTPPWTPSRPGQMICAAPDRRRRHGHCGLAAEPGPREVAFRENEIDETVLPNLTAEDLKELASPHWGTAASSSMQSLLCVSMQVRKLQTSRKNPQNHRLRRQLDRPSQKPLASVDISR